MISSLVAGMAGITALQVIVCVAVSLLVIAVPFAIVKGFKNRKEITNSIGEFAGKINPKTWGKPTPSLATE